MAHDRNGNSTGTGIPLSADAATIRKRSVMIGGHRTSISIENAFWHALLQIADARGISANRLITEIDRNRTGNLSSAIRLYVLAEALDRTTGWISGYRE